MRHGKARNPAEAVEVDRAFSIPRFSQKGVRHSWVDGGAEQPFHAGRNVLIGRRHSLP